MADNNVDQHLNAVGQDGRPNINFLYEKVISKDPEMKIEWVDEEGKNGNDLWKATLIVRLSDGQVTTYSGDGRRKGHARDAAAYSYLLIHGFITALPT